MAKSSKKPLAAAAAVVKKVVSSTKAPIRSEVRNSPIPKPVKPAAAAAKVATAPRPVTHDAIAQRAYEIHLSGTGGSESDNWFRAERELRGGL